MQKRKPQWLPAKLRTWEWLPVWMRSLEPMDRVLCAPLGNCLYKVWPCKSKCGCTKTENDASETTTSSVPNETV